MKCSVKLNVMSVCEIQLKLKLNVGHPWLTAPPSAQAAALHVLTVASHAPFRLTNSTTQKHSRST